MAFFSLVTSLWFKYLSSNTFLSALHASLFASPFGAPLPPSVDSPTHFLRSMSTWYRVGKTWFTFTDRTNGLILERFSTFFFDIERVTWRGLRAIPAMRTRVGWPLRRESGADCDSRVRTTTALRPAYRPARTITTLPDSYGEGISRGAENPYKSVRYSERFNKDIIPSYRYDCNENGCIWTSFHVLHLIYREIHARIVIIQWNSTPILPYRIIQQSITYRGSRFLNTMIIIRGWIYGVHSMMHFIVVSLTMSPFVHSLPAS